MEQRNYWALEYILSKTESASTKMTEDTNHHINSQDNLGSEDRSIIYIYTYARNNKHTHTQTQ